MVIEKGPHPAVTVIMPAFNSARTLRDSAESVLDQSVRSLELIIVDDASSDSTAAIAAELAARDPRVRLIARTVRGGPAAARNTGIDAARARYLAFCDADDLWLAAKLEQQLDVARSSDAALVYSAYHRIDADFAGPVAAFRGDDGRVVHVPTTITHSQLRRGNVIGCLTALIDVERTGSVQMPDVPGAEDWALWLSIVRAGGRAVGIDEPLALYRASAPGSHSAQRGRALRAVWRVLRTQERLSPPAAALYLVTNASEALRKARI